MPRGKPLALLHLIFWLIHAVAKAIASAIVDVFTSLIGLLIAGAVVVIAALALIGVFGVGGVVVHRKRRRRSR